MNDDLNKKLQEHINNSNIDPTVHGMVDWGALINTEPKVDSWHTSTPQWDPGMFAQQAANIQSEREIRDRLRRLREENERVKEFREKYIQVRTNNIVLDHQTAIELVKMIFTEADTLGYSDTV